MRDTRHGQGGGGASGAGGGRKCVQELENISDLFIFSRLYLIHSATKLVGPVYLDILRDKIPVQSLEIVYNGKKKKNHLFGGVFLKSLFLSCMKM